MFNVAASVYLLNSLKHQPMQQQLLSDKELNFCVIDYGSLMWLETGQVTSI